MAEQISLTNLVNLQNQTTAVTAINGNNAILENAFLDVLSLSGVTPNQMQSDLDMNSNQILNLPNPATANSPLRLSDLTTFTGGGTVTNIPIGGIANQVLTKTSNTNYAVGWQSLGALSGLSVVAGKTLTVNNTITLQGTDSTVFTLPNASDTLVALTSTQTLANKTITSPTINQINMPGSSSGAVTFTPATSGSNWTMTLPSTAGSNGFFLQTNGSGVTTWAAAAGGGTQPTIQSFTSGTAQTYTTPANVKWLEVYIQGGGGNGGNGGSGGAGGGGAGGGGSSGALVYHIIDNPGTTGTYTVGTNGVSSTFTMSSPSVSITANAGATGTAGGNGGTTTGGLGGGGGSSSTGTGGIRNLSSHAGGAGGTGSFSSVNGNGGTGGTGGGSGGGSGNGGNASTNSGAGGAGGNGGANGAGTLGGSGAAGYVLVVEHYV